MSDPIEAILRAATNEADEAEVLFITGESIEADLKQRDIAIGSKAVASGIVVRVIKDGRIGVSCCDTPEFWEKCLAAALSSSKFSDQIEWKSLPEPAELDRRNLAWDERVEPDPTLASDLISQMRSGAETREAEITSGSVSLSQSSHILANTNGLWYESKATNVSLGLEMIASQSTGYESDSSWRLDGINPEKIGSTAGFFAEKGQKCEDIKTGSYEIVLSPMALAELLNSTVIPALSGRNVHARRSFFAGKMGEEVIAPHISLIDDPFDCRGVANCAYDGEGMPVREISFISDGRLASYAYDLKTAYRYGAEPTASAVRSGQSGAPSIGNHNLIFRGKESDIMKEGSVYIHHLIGAHTANPMSGDFSVELSSPFFISDGKLEKPIKTGMLSGNVFELLSQVTGCSTETRTLGSLILPSVGITGAVIVGRG